MSWLMDVVSKELKGTSIDICYTHIYSTIIHNSQEMEAIDRLING